MSYEEDEGYYWDETLEKSEITEKLDILFEKHAREIFIKANISLDTLKAKELFEDTKRILSEKMAALSVCGGFTWERIKRYNSQKAVLIDDLKGFLKEHPDGLNQLGNGGKE